MPLQTYAEALPKLKEQSCCIPAAMEQEWDVHVDAINNYLEPPPPPLSTLEQAAARHWGSVDEPKTSDIREARRKLIERAQSRRVDPLVADMVLDELAGNRLPVVLVGVVGEYLFHYVFAESCMKGWPMAYHYGNKDYPWCSNFHYQWFTKKAIIRADYLMLKWLVLRSGIDVTVYLAVVGDVYCRSRAVIDVKQLNEITPNGPVDLAEHLLRISVIEQLPAERRQEIVVQLPTTGIQDPIRLVECIDCSALHKDDDKFYPMFERVKWLYDNIGLMCLDVSGVQRARDLLFSSVDPLMARWMRKEREQPLTIRWLASMVDYDEWDFITAERINILACMPGILNNDTPKGSQFASLFVQNQGGLYLGGYRKLVVCLLGDHPAVSLSDTKRSN